MARRLRRDQLEDVIKALNEARASLEEYVATPPRGQAKAKLEEAVAAFQLAATDAIHPQALPMSVFDPSDTRMFGQFAALALVAQQREPLGSIAPTYGSGVYALYYSGDFDPYEPIARTETPIYVGKAQALSAGDLRAQGTAITNRLSEHASSIQAVHEAPNGNLLLDDFEYRRLVIVPGWEDSAERALMGLFHPLWNHRHGPIHGVGKHGDDPETRKNGRSPWDTLHPGRPWASAIGTDQKSYAQILAEIGTHFQKHPPVKDQDAVLASYLRTVGEPR